MSLLTILGYSIVVVFMVLIMTKRLTAFSALIIVPIVFAYIGGFGLTIGKFALTGIKGVATTSTMLLFAILFFGIMINVGLFDPLVKAIVKFVKGDPVKVLVGTAILAALVSVDGDGSTTTMIVCSALLPVYKKLKIKPLYLATIIIMQNSIMNLLPWGGPTARIIAALKLESSEILNPLIPGMILAIIYVIGVAYILGLKERKRLGIVQISEAAFAELAATSEEEEALKRPKLIWVNFILTIAVMVILIMGDIPSSVIFEVGAALALLINYRDIKTQREVIERNAGNAVQVIVMILAAGIFMGILTESGMATAIAKNLASVVPKSLGSHWTAVTAVISVPGTFMLSNDAFYLGVLPVLAKTGVAYGFTPLQIGIAATMGQAFHLLSPLVGFIYLLLQLTGVDMGEWQRHSAKWSIGTFIIFVLAASLTGVMPL
ncbi:citrate transporter [Clostridium carboxidivorans P7]|uniref:Citrate/H+ symporter, CitMHS family n=1 Tax=Clostridium carboxidivorans P7 TaxID=536227 RepID=C6Q0M7_9CLOT|nr:citrate:proton symporter [Clostridium carboxidivorans]AKN32442.1 citrate transporter [Clostridium carboxidivorans P7]EET84964.1 citrate/H+ symporter, CitMHS family [Clostridium carboxidivorans P7]EFG87690.1 citrate transporter [Clostridium carboxidivorans P7]